MHRYFLFVLTLSLSSCYLAKQGGQGKDLFIQKREMNTMQVAGSQGVEGASASAPSGVLQSGSLNIDPGVEVADETTSSELGLTSEVETAGQYSIHPSSGSLLIAHAASFPQSKNK